MPKAVQIVFGLIGLALIVYIAILGMTAFFDWINPGGGSGRMVRLSAGAVVGLAITVAVIAFRRFRS